jgi:hypothetical protein
LYFFRSYDIFQYSPIFSPILPIFLFSDPWRYFSVADVGNTGPNYAKDFQIFSFASEDTIAGVLFQKNDDGQEQPIAFMSKALQNSELNYTTMEKQAYALVKSLKHFRVYIGYSRGVCTSPNGKRYPWTTRLFGGHGKVGFKNTRV